MPKLYDRQGNEVVVPEDEVLDALASGQLGVDGGVDMISPDGDSYNMTIEEALEAKRLGWSLETDEQKYNRELQRDYGDATGQAIAALAGAARGFTFGLSDVVLTAGGVDKETLRKYQEANPAMSMTGEFGAIGTSILLSGGLAAPTVGKSLLRAATAGPRAAAKAGLGVEAAVSRLAVPLAEKGLFGKAAAKAMSLGAGSSIEGALYSGGKYISETSLGNLDFTAENLVSEMGVGALWGGAFGAGLGAGIATVGGLTKKTADSIVNMWKRETGNEPVKGLGEALYRKYAKTADVVLPEGQTLTQFGTKEARASAVKNLDETADMYGRMGAKIEDDILPNKEIVLKNWAELKPDEMRALAKEYQSSMPKGVEDIALVEVDEMMSKAISTLEEMVSKETGGKGIYAAQPSLRDMLKRFQKKDFRIDKLALETKEDIAGSMFSVLDAAKRDIGRVADKLGRMSPGPDVIESMERLTSLFNDFRGSLVKKEIWGQLAETQAEINFKYHKYLQSKAYTMKNKLHRLWKKPGFNERTFKADAGGYKNLWKGSGLAENDLDMQYIVEHWEDRAALIGEFRKSLKWDRDPAKYAKEIAAAERAIKSTKELQDLHNKAVNEIGLINQLESIKKSAAASGLSAEAGGIGGYMVGGPVGAAIGYGIGSVINPERLIRQLATIDRISARVGTKFKSGIEKYINRVTKAAGKGGGKVKRLVAPSAVGAMERHTGVKGQLEAFEKLSDEVSRIAMDPAYTQDKLEQATRPFSDAAPQLASKLQQKAVVAANYLMEKLPKDPGRPTAIKSKWKPTKMQLDRFEKTYQAVQDPLSVVRDLENGLISPEGVEALKEIYPEIFNRVLVQITENMDKLQDLPYAERIRLSALFEVPIDQSFDPKFIAAMQAAQTRPDPASLGQPRRLASGPSTGLESNLTQSQRLSLKG